MMGCKQIKTLIDEAERPNLLPYEAASHVAECPSCGAFAGERESLRELLAAQARVAAPLNFDATLQARLRQRRAGRAPSWLVPAGYLRFGAVTAALLVAALGAQYGGFFNRRPAEAIPVVNETSSVGASALKVDVPGSPIANPTPVIQQPNQAQRPRWIRNPRGATLVAGNSTEPGVMITDHQVVIVRGPKGDQVIPMQTVSMGAQPLLYGNGAQARPPAARTVLTTF